MISDERQEGYNIGWDVVGDRCITTGALSTSITGIGYTLIFETLIWEWDGEKRNRILHQIHHPNEKIAKKVHEQILNNFRSESNE